MARHANLTKDKSVAALRWQDGDPVQFLVKDPDRTGFNIRLSKGGTKSWMYQFRFEGQLERLSLGKYPGTKCATAFDRYDKAREQVQAGENPAAKKREKKRQEVQQQRTNALTVHSLFYDHFFPRYAKPRKRTWKNDEGYFRTRIEPAFVHLRNQPGSHPDDGPPGFPAVGNLTEVNVEGETGAITAGGKVIFSSSSLFPLINRLGPAERSPSGSGQLPVERRCARYRCPQFPVFV